MRKKFNLLFIGLLIVAIAFSGCTSSTVAPASTASTPVTTIPSPIITTIIISIPPTTTAPSTIETSEPTTNQTEISTPTETVTVIPTLSQPVSISYRGESSWKEFQSEEDQFTIHYPVSRWAVYSAKKLGTGEYASVLKDTDTMKYRLRDFIYIVSPYLSKPTYNSKNAFFKDSDEIVGIFGFNFLDLEGPIEYDGKKITAPEYVRYDLKDILSEQMTVENFQKDPTPYKINGNNATHITYDLTRYDKKRSSDAYIVQKGTKYYVVAFLGGSGRVDDYDQKLVRKIMQSFETS